MAWFKKTKTPTNKPFSEADTREGKYGNLNGSGIAKKGGITVAQGMFACCALFFVGHLYFYNRFNG
jgi:hypothetical protein